MIFRYGLLCVPVFFLAYIEVAIALPDLGDFFENDSIGRIGISPDGHRYYSVKETDSNFIVKVHNIGDGTQRVVFDFKQLFDSAKSTLASVFWVDSRYIGVNFVEDGNAIADLENTKYRYQMYFVDIDNIPQSKSDLYTIRTSGRVINSLPNEAGKFLYSKRGIVSRVYKIDVEKLHKLEVKLDKSQRIDGGQFHISNITAKIDGFSYRWFYAEDEVVGCLILNRDKEFVLMKTPDNGVTWSKLKVLKEAPKDESKNKKKKKKNKEKEEKSDKDAERLFPIGYAGKDGEYYVVVENDNQPDALYRYSFNDEGKELIYQHSVADIFRVITSYKENKLLGVGIAYKGEPKYVYFDSAYGDIVNSIKSRGYPGYLALVGSDLSGNIRIAYNFSSSNPGKYLLYDQSKKTVKKLADIKPSLANKISSELFVGQVDNDGLSIEYFLTIPKAAKNGGVPLIVIPHGGPVGIMDHRLYDPLTQYLASREYAVLQVNYRGSAGYGREFIEAGKKQWGSGMLSDINTALLEVSTRPDINMEKVCVVGGSYGGYAALTLPLQYPGIYRCAASFAGVTDVQLHVSQLDATKESIEWLIDYIGDPEVDAEKLRKLSPVYGANNYKLPIFIAHGEEDEVVDIEHFYRMIYALKQANIPFESHVIEGLGHGFENKEQAVELYSRLTKFLAQHLN